MSRALLVHAAELLEAQARTLRNSYTLNLNDIWTNPAAKADHDDHALTAHGLRALADQIVTEQKGRKA